MVEEDPLHAIVDLNQKLQALDIKLIFCPAPPRAAIYPDKVLESVRCDDSGIPQRVDPTLQAFYAELARQGVAVVDITDAFLTARRDGDKEPVCCPQDSHWSPRGIGIAAHAVADYIRESVALPTQSPATLAVQPAEPLAYIGDLAGRAGDAEAPPPTQTTIHRVTADPAGNLPLAFDADAPVLLLADSHGLVFSTGEDMHCSAAGFGEHLSAELGFAIDVMARRGSGDQVRRDLARRFLQNPSDVQKKRVLIYTFAARTLTESTRWKIVPLQR